MSPLIFLASTAVIFLALALRASYSDAEDAPPTFNCPGAGSFPNPDDCGSYYVCPVSNDPVLMECPLGTLFDPEISICNNEASVTCSDSTSSSSSSSSSTTSSSTTSTTSVPTTSSTTPAPICPSTGTIRLVYPGDCTKFYFCIDGDYVILSCPAGHGFDPETGGCKIAGESGCNTSSSTSTPAPSSTPPQDVDPECPESGNGVTPNTNDCSSFFYCADGNAFLITCPVDMEFSVATQRCEKTEKAGCSVESTSSSPRPTGTTTSPTSPPTGTTPNPTGSTPKPTSTTPSPTPDCSSRPNGAIFPNPADCSGYLQCSNGAIISNNCPPGLEFNSQLSVCDQPASANCKETFFLVPL